MQFVRAIYPKVDRAVLVYQRDGVCSIFAVDSFNMSNYGRNARLITHGDREGCKCIALGLAHAGAYVRTAYCNLPGDVSRAKWSEDSTIFADRDGMVSLTLNGIPAATVGNFNE